MRRLLSVLIALAVPLCSLCAGTLKFNGTSDKLKWTTLQTVLSQVSDGAWTMCVVLKRDTTGSFRAISYLLSSTGNGVAEAGASFTNTSVTTLDFGSAVTSTTALTNTTNPYMLVISKGAGTVTPRIGFKNGSGGAWTHENYSGTQANRTAATMLEIGAWEAIDFYSGWIGVVAFWEGAMSDAQKEALDDNWRTSDLWNSAFGQPKFLVELNVAGSSAVDLAGNASSLTATGTTLDSGETLNSWNFDGTGGAAPTPPRRRQIRFQ